MQQVDTMDITFRTRAHMRHFEVLAQREMTLTIYPDGPSMTKLGVIDSVMYLLNQLGWENFDVIRRFSSYHSLTLEFLSSLSYDPTQGIRFNRGTYHF